MTRSASYHGRQGHGWRRLERPADRHGRVAEDSADDGRLGPAPEGTLIERLRDQKRCQVVGGNPGEKLTRKGGKLVRNPVRRGPFSVGTDTEAPASSAAAARPTKRPAPGRNRLGRGAGRAGIAESTGAAMKVPRRTHPGAQRGRPESVSGWPRATACAHLRLHFHTLARAPHSGGRFDSGIGTTAAPVLRVGPSAHREPDGTAAAEGAARPLPLQASMIRRVSDALGEREWQ